MTDEAYLKYLTDRLRNNRQALVAVMHGNIRATYCGICYNANLTIFDCLADVVIVQSGLRIKLRSTEVVTDVMRQWPHFTGNLTWPVPEPAITDSLNIWRGLQGAYRRSLCIFLLEQIRNAIGD